MKVELIPVLELPYYSQEIDSPENSPYWEYPKQWQAYNEKCLAKAGFKDSFIPYRQGSCFYRLTDITDNNLVKVIDDHFLSITEGTYDEEQACALFGGYVLKVAGEDKLFPQCCGDLSDISYWQQIVQTNRTDIHSGHPSPEIKFKNHQVILKCQNDYEPFIPPTDEHIIVPLSALKLAYEDVLLKLRRFEIKLESIKDQLQYTPRDKTLADILIYDK